MAERTVGLPAPQFELEALLANGDFGTVSLKEIMNQGKWTVLFFYPLDFTFVCPTEIIAMSDRYEDFKKLNAEVIGVSTDSKFSHLAWTNAGRNENGIGKINYSLGADTTHKAARDYGVLIEEEGIALRGTFIIDPDGVMMYEAVFHNNIGRNVDEMLRVLQALQSGGLCPINWRSGQATL